jgi:hypothetical protein
MREQNQKTVIKQGTKLWQCRAGFFFNSGHAESVNATIEDRIPT